MEAIEKLAEPFKAVSLENTDSVGGWGNYVTINSTALNCLFYLVHVLQFWKVENLKE